jgi:hypothetical protein
VLLIDEHIRPDGSVVRTHLEGDPDHVTIIADDGTHGRLSVFALDKVMRRYGRALDPSIEVAGKSLDFGGGHRLTHLRWRAPVDADARDWLVWSTPGEEPLAALSNGVAAALRYLVMRLAAEGLSDGGAPPPATDDDDADDDKDADK